MEISVDPVAPRVFCSVSVRTLTEGHGKKTQSINRKARLIEPAIRDAYKLAQNVFSALKTNIDVA